MTHLNTISPKAIFSNQPQQLPVPGMQPSKESPVLYISFDKFYNPNNIHAYIYISTWFFTYIKTSALPHRKGRRGSLARFQRWRQQSRAEYLHGDARPPALARINASLFFFFVASGARTIKPSYVMEYNVRDCLCDFLSFSSVFLIAGESRDFRLARHIYTYKWEIFELMARNGECVYSVIRVEWSVWLSDRKVVYMMVFCGNCA